MKEMIYSANRLKTPERIAEGEYKGFTYYVLSLGTHPCAYIDVTKTKLNGENYDDIDIECHCGLTYSREYLSTVEKKGWFIGWDYAHYCDFAGYEINFLCELRTNGKRWTTEEIVGECKEVIDQIVNKYSDEVFKLLEQVESEIKTGECGENQKSTEAAKKTNFDRITESAESLAEFIVKGVACPFNYSDQVPCHKQGCKECIKEWLQKECEQ